MNYRNRNDGILGQRNVEDQRGMVEAHVNAKLEEYGTQKLKQLVGLVSFSRIRRRLHRDAKRLTKKCDLSTVPEAQIITWIDEILDRITSQIPNLEPLSEWQEGLTQSFPINIFSSSLDGSQWEQLQLQRARTILPEVNVTCDGDLLAAYRKYIDEKLTPSKTDPDNRTDAKKRPTIDLDTEYAKEEANGRQYLIDIISQFKQRGRPNLILLNEMITLGMNQMLKQPTADDLRKAAMSSNLFIKAGLLLKIERAYKMNLKNIADDFRFRFGRVSDQHAKRDTINEQFMSFIHTFLTAIFYLIRMLKQDIPEMLSSLVAFHTKLPYKDIFSPYANVDQWTWLLEKWKLALQILPLSLTCQGAFERLVRTTIGVGMVRLYAIAEKDEPAEINEIVFQALQIGYYYGVAYAFVDGMQDNHQQTVQKKDLDKWLVEMERVLCGGQLDRSSLPQLSVTSLALETFDSLVQLTTDNSTIRQVFTNLALLLRSQRCDKKDYSTPNYDEVDIFIGSVMKSHFIHTTTVLMGGAQNVDSREHLWTIPFFGQLNDDCRDFSDDRRTSSLTPVTHFAQHGRSSLNPFYVYLFLSEEIYLQSNRQPSTGAYLGRRILRTLQALQLDLTEFLQIFTAETYPDLQKYTLSLRNQFAHVSDPDKSIFRSINECAMNYSRTNRLLDTFAYDHLPLIEQQLPIKSQEKIDDPLIRGMNHSLQAGGKRIRPLLLLMVGHLFSIDIERLIPLAHAFEYLHTSSLILDDLPAQDNAPMRRGRPTLHTSIGDDEQVPLSLAEGRAQLAAVDLIAYAMLLVAVDLKQNGFSLESVNRVAAEIAQAMRKLCQGQFLDLQSARLTTSHTSQEASLAHLDHIAQLKTGKALEIVLICPAILAKDDGTPQNVIIDRLRELGLLMGLLFQMKDDLLDVEGDSNELGKVTFIDQRNQMITYPSLLGIEGTRERIRTLRKQAEQIVDELWPQAGTLKDLIRHICERHK